MPPWKCRDARPQAPAPDQVENLDSLFVCCTVYHACPYTGHMHPHVNCVYLCRPLEQDWTAVSCKLTCRLRYDNQVPRSGRRKTVVGVECLRSGLATSRPLHQGYHIYLCVRGAALLSPSRLISPSTRSFPHSSAVSYHDMSLQSPHGWSTFVDSPLMGFAPVHLSSSAIRLIVGNMHWTRCIQTRP